MEPAVVIEYDHPRHSAPAQLDVVGELGDVDGNRLATSLEPAAAVRPALEAPLDLEERLVAVGLETGAGVGAFAERREVGYGDIDAMLQLRRFEVVAGPLRDGKLLMHGSGPLPLKLIAEPEVAVSLGPDGGPQIRGAVLIARPAVIAVAAPGAVADEKTLIRVHDLVLNASVGRAIRGRVCAGLNQPANGFHQPMDVAHRIGARVVLLIAMPIVVALLSM